MVKAQKNTTLYNVYGKVMPALKVMRWPAFGRVALLIALLMPFAADVRAQQEPIFAHYWDMEAQFNPAAVGHSSELNILAAFQSHASGFQDAGSTMYAGADMPFRIGRTLHGVGALFSRDEIGLFAHQRFALQYAFHFKLFGGTFSVGAAVDMLNEKVDGSKADLGDANDPAFPSTEMSGSKFDVSAGLYYRHGPWYAGISGMHLTMPTVLLGETNEIKVKSLYNLTGGYNIKTRNPLFTIVPSTMMRFDGNQFRADITTRLLYARDKKRLYGGASYAPQHAVTLFVGGRFHGVDLSYSYEANTSGMGLESGNHEITLCYRMDLNLGKKGKNLHKSVRYL